MAKTRSQIQADYRERRAQGIPLRHKRVVNEDGRECAYSGEGNCGHQFKPWDEYGPGDGPQGKERRCKECMTAKALDYAKRQPDPVKQRKNAQQTVYQKTDAGKESCRRAKLKYRYGISAYEYDQLLEKQDGLCYLCGLEETIVHHASGQIMLLGVEHDHACTEGHDPKKGCRKCVRGLACYNCNIFMARVERSELLRPRFLDLLDQRPLLSAA